MSFSRLTLMAFFFGAALLIFSFVVKWVIFDTLLENDGTGKQSVENQKP